MAFGEAVGIQEKLEAEYGEKVDYRRDLAQSHATAAQLLKGAGPVQDINKLCRLALSHLELLAEEPAGEPEQQWKLAELCKEVGHRLPASPEEEKAFHLAVKLGDRFLANAPSHAYSRELQGHSYRYLAFIAKRKRDRLPETEKYFRLALRIFEDLHAEFPHVAIYQQFLAGTLSDLGKTLAVSGDTNQAKQFYQRSVEVMKKR